MAHTKTTAPAEKIPFFKRFFNQNVAGKAELSGLSRHVLRDIGFLEPVEPQNQSRSAYGSLMRDSRAFSSGLTGL